MLRLDSGKFGFVDVRGGRITGNQRLACEMTIRAGQIVFDFNGRAGSPLAEGAYRLPRQIVRSRRAAKAYHG